MVTHPVELADTARGAPYYASSLRIASVGRHRRRDYLDLLAVVGGEGRHITWDAADRPRVRHLVPGRLALYRPGDEVAFAGRGASGFDALYVSFPFAEWQSFAGIVGIDPRWASEDEPPLASFDPGDDAVIRPFLHALERFRAGPTAFDLVRFWLEVVPVILPARDRVRGAGAPGWLTAAVDAFRRDDENLRAGLPRLLELAHVSAPHLTATVRRYYGRTPTDLVQELRVRRAAVLLSTTLESVGSIAARCGFGDPAYFSNRFRREHHLSPREYRARALGGHLGRPR